LKIAGETIPGKVQALLEHLILTQILCPIYGSHQTI
jgi:hypothetical protein